MELDWNVTGCQEVEKVELTDLIHEPRPRHTPLQAFVQPPRNVIAEWRVHRFVHDV